LLHNNKKLSFPKIKNSSFRAVLLSDNVLVSDLELKVIDDNDDEFFIFVIVVNNTTRSCSCYETRISFAVKSGMKMKNNI